jgi:2-dehydro-3-deoxygalactonokinase
MLWRDVATVDGDAAFQAGIRFIIQSASLDPGAIRPAHP